MSLISGVKKPLGHTNSFCGSGSTLPKFGVDTKPEYEPELSKVQREIIILK